MGKIACQISFIKLSLYKRTYVWYNVIVATAKESRWYYARFDCNFNHLPFGCSHFSNYFWKVVFKPPRRWL